MTRIPRSPTLLLTVALTLAGPATLPALQDTEQAAAPGAFDRPVLRAGRATSEIAVDGVLDEAGWSAAARIPVDVEWFPGDNVAAPVETVALVTYDDHDVFIGFEAADPEPGRIRAHLMDRDGIKLTGKKDRHAFGLFASSDDVNALVIPGNQGSASAFLEESVTGSVARYRRDLGRNSSLGVLYAGREGNDYHNRVGGLDAFIRFSGTDTLAVQVLHSDTRYPEALAERFGQQHGAFGGDALEIDYNHFAREWLWSLS